ncbi:V-type proton ATPase subunit E [Clostridium homopropionicum DSM 5847]|uniref:V-type proton ATPase subunit E n=1 Tax=Clostridium homopropionicum DSM 5847 TaxID=1121318 RepID=A0A0L6ZEF4_9CLOT|nr:V-type ATP synthase subunit E family protein [Clostridium homopropionicum]KOA21364.1 V-type proton ATPase subunit E [Clostridium homopropionicum DSM 5847]SFG12262.1 V/A-type H+-transporting ATPase subunit E [Clostridium homopropionicum]
MSNIESLTSKILEDSDIKAKALIEEAKQEEKSILDKKKREAEIESKIIIDKAEAEAKIRAERVISNAEIQVRNMKLEAKQIVLDRVFTEALERLSLISKDDTLEFIKKSLLSSEILGNEELILDENIASDDFVAKINSYLKELGRKGELKLSTEKRDIKGGYILAKNGIEINYTFEALVKLMRDELEAEVAGILFS